MATDRDPDLECSVAHGELVRKGPLRDNSDRAVYPNWKQSRNDLMIDSSPRPKSLRNDIDDTEASVLLYSVRQPAPTPAQ